MTERAHRILYAINPVHMVADFWRHRDLILQFTRREVESRYQGSFLGLLWSLVTPVVMLTVYVFVFGIVFKSRWPSAGGSGSLGEFALVMFAGQIAFQIFAEPVGRAPSLISSTPNFVRKVVFPLQILPLTAVGAAAFHAAIASVILLLASVVIVGGVPWTFVLVPFAILPLVLIGLGFTMFLAALGVYLRDMGFVVGVALQILFFLTPIFYPLSAVPAEYRQWMSLNPLTPSIEIVRACLITGDLPGWPVWAATFLVGAGILVLGNAWFMITRKGFADVI